MNFNKKIGEKTVVYPVSYFLERALTKKGERH